jgi:membrane-bound lytic murein transglycosylase A
MTLVSPMILRQISFSNIKGWAVDDHATALETFKRSLDEIRKTAHGFKREALFGGQKKDWLTISEAALRTTSAREFFENNFTPCEVRDPVRPEGLFTGYYEPEAEGSPIQTKEYQVPIYRKPRELVALDAESQKITGLAYGVVTNGKAEAFFTRKQIEEGALAHRELEIVWLKSWVDAFFIHVQGSGRIVLHDGHVIRLAYAGKNGRPYTGIGGVLLKRGIATPKTMSMQVLREWMASNPDEARALMWENNSFIFFRDIAVPDDKLGALGAQQVHLTPRRSLAVDRSIWMFGTPIWLDTATPPESPNGSEPFRHLMVAQDTGTAIRGHVRGDVYWGWGNDAALIAGNMKSPGRMVVLLPNALAERLVQKS